MPHDTCDMRLRFAQGDTDHDVSALLARAPRPRAILTLAHGAGAGMNHRFMDAIAHRLADQRISTLRYNFPYMERGRRAPDRPPLLLACVRAAIDAAAAAEPDLPLFAGGKSMGGRMTSTLLAATPDPSVCGIVFFGFPLHPAGRTSDKRAAHLRDVTTPMLFLQGTRDKLADMTLLEPICSQLDLATLHVVEGADHGFGVLKRSGRTDEDALDELAETAGAWCAATHGP